MELVMTVLVAVVLLGYNDIDDSDDIRCLVFLNFRLVRKGRNRSSDGAENKDQSSSSLRKQG